jgi:uncharacterized glyoxalase superfamily protein PhnB
MAVKPIPDGFHTVTPYLVVPGAAKLLDFLKKAFGAVEIHRTEMPNGVVMHAQVKIGDSFVLMGEAQGPNMAMPAMLYLYVENTDALYHRALEAGAVSVMAPADQFYGDRNAGVKDFAGNQWWIATHFEDVAPEEIARRAQAARA